MASDLHGLLQPPTPPVLENPSAEAGILSSILMRNTDFDAIAEIVKPSDFACEWRGEMFRLCAEAIGAGRRVDPATMMADFTRNPAISAYGAQKAVVEIINGALPAPAGLLKGYAQDVADFACRRALQKIGQSLLWGESEEGDTASTILSRTQEALQSLSSGVDGLRQGKTAQEASMALLRETEVSWKSGSFLSGLDCGYRGLNDKIRGFRAGAMYVIAARPGMGKSALGLGLAVRMALTSGRGLFWSGEMAAEELMARAVSAKCGLTLDTVLTGMIDGPAGPERVSDKTMERIVYAGMEAGKIPLVIDDREGLTIQQIAVRARRMAREPEGLKFVVLDYIGLMQASEAARRSGNRVQEVTEISAGIARMARELKIPVIALSQLNRQSEGREDKRPAMSDIRDSGAIEQDARCIMAIYREEAALRSRIGSDGQLVRNANESEVSYQKRSGDFDAALERTKGRAEVIVLKNRGGKTGIVDMWFDGPSTFFRDITEDEKGVAW